MNFERTGNAFGVLLCRRLNHDSFEKLGALLADLDGRHRTFVGEPVIALHHSDVAEHVADDARYLVALMKAAAASQAPTNDTRHAKRLVMIGLPLESSFESITNVRYVCGPTLAERRKEAGACVGSRPPLPRSRGEGWGGSRQWQRPAQVAVAVLAGRG